MGNRSSNLLVLAIFVSLAAALVLPALGEGALWSDEAETALVGRNILRSGIPSARDGENLVTINTDHRDVRGDVYIWQPWLQMYLAAASMAVFGSTAFAARLPFALAFVVLIGVSYHVFRRWSGDRHTAMLGAALMLFSVPLLLHARQCRYYVLVPLFSLLVVQAYRRLVAAPTAGRAALLVLWSTLLFHALYPALVLLGLALAIDLLRLRPGRDVLRLLAGAAGATLLLNLPVAAYCRVWYRPFGRQPGYSSIEAFGTYLLRYALTLDIYFFPAIILVLAIAWRFRERFRRRGASLQDTTAMVSLVCAVQLVGVSLIANYPFTRYLLGMTPFLMFLGAGCMRSVTGGRSWLSWTLFAVVAATNWLHVLPLPLLRPTPLASERWDLAGVDSRLLEPGRFGIRYARGEIARLIEIPAGSPLAEYARSLLHPPRGPIDHIVEFLNREAAATDRVKISYGALPLMFHTNLKVTSDVDVGPPAPEWIIERHFNHLRADEAFWRETLRYRYASTELPVADVQWNNRPDPLYHRYRDPDARAAPRVRIMRRMERGPRSDLKRGAPGSARSSRCEPIAVAISSTPPPPR